MRTIDEESPSNTLAIAIGMLNSAPHCACLQQWREKSPVKSPLPKCMPKLMSFCDSKRSSAVEPKSRTRYSGTD